MAKSCKIIFLLLFSSISLTAQNSDIQFDHLSVDDGLSNNVIWSILQDSNGFMWIATEDGLNKYDGYKFTVYRHDPDDSLSISGNWIHTLLESHYGGRHVLWIATTSGLNRLDLDTEHFTHFSNNPEDPQSLSHDWVVSIYEDSFGELWIGTDGGINKFDRESEKFIRYQHDPKDPTSLSNNSNCTIDESLIDGTSILWIGTGFGGLNKFDRKTEKFTRYKHDPHNKNSLSRGVIDDLLADTSGILWIATNNSGLNKFNIETEQFTRFQYNSENSNSISSNMVSSILKTNFQGNNVLWLATFNGLDRFDLETEKFTHYKHNPNNSRTLCDNHVNALYKDRTGCIWIGTFGGGLSKFDPGRQKFTHIQQETGAKNGLSHKIVLSITESKYFGPDVFWIGTKDGGLNKYDKYTGNFTHYRHSPGNPNSLSSDFIITLFESQFQGRHELWVGTIDGLDKFDLRTKKFTRYQYDPGDPYSISNNIIRSIFEDNSGMLWIGTRNGGLNRFDRSSGKFHRKRYYIGEVISIIKDYTGTLWAGTHRGLAKYDDDSKKFNHYVHDPDDKNSISHSYVISMYEDKSFRLWIGTYDGLNLYDRETNKFTRYMVSDGLPNNVINGILEDDIGNLWLSTNHGLSKFNPEKETFRNYDMNDGLQGNQFGIGASCLSQKGEMLFGGANGFNVFHPENVKDNPHLPEIHFTDFKIFNKHVDVKTGMLENHNGAFYLPQHISNTSEITLSYEESVFSFEFAALNYNSPQKNEYAYKMEGVDPDWVYTDASRRFATYTQLDPGKYVFRVKGSNNDGLWNEEGTSITIIITPPWWRTSLAYTFYILAIGLIIVATWRFQTNRLRMKHELDLEHVRAEKFEEVDHLKSRFFANISHEFRTPLTLILGPVEQMLIGDFKGNIKEQYQVIIHNAKRLLQLINQLLDLSKLESGNLKLQAQPTEIISLTNGLTQAFESLAVRKSISLKFNTDLKSQEIYLDIEKYETIINNLVGNAFKFTPEMGEIDVSVSKGTVHRSTRDSNFMINYAGRSGSRTAPTLNMVLISISNTGPGIPPDKIHKIFNRFYQVNDSYAKDGEGTGIGLALTKELVELHHGSIEIDCVKSVQKNAPKKGAIYLTKFTIKLPIGKEHLSADEIREKSETVDRSPQTGVNTTQLSDSSLPSPVSVNQSPVSGLQSPAVLIVEDNPDVTSYISSFLNHDYRILTAENGKVGWKMAVKNYPDLIISDVMMPEMDGFELCKKIKSDQRTSHMPVILLTAKADLDSKIEGLEFGADDYISKPFDSNELKVRSKNLIGLRKKLRDKFAHMIEICPGEVTATSMDEQFLKRLLDIFENHVADSNFSVDDFAREVGMSRSNLYRKLEALTNQSTHEFIRSLRLKRAAQLLKKSSGSVTEIAYAVGFNNLSYFSKTFRQQFGLTPRQYASTNQ